MKKPLVTTAVQDFAKKKINHADTKKWNHSVILLSMKWIWVNHLSSSDFFLVAEQILRSISAATNMC